MSAFGGKADITATATIPIVFGVSEDPVSAAVNQIRVHHQPSNGANARHRGAAWGCAQSPTRYKVSATDTNARPLGVKFFNLSDARHIAARRFTLVSIS